MNLALLLGLVGCATRECCPPSEELAGHPFEVAPWAAPSDTGHYTGYEVGGGNPCPGGDEPGPDGRPPS